MKIWKLMGKRGFAVFTSLVLCASLVAPSFAAATFADLNSAIQGPDGSYGENDEITRAGNTITLNGEVKRAEGEGSIKIEAGDNITLDLNGQKIDGNKEATSSAIIHVNGGNLTIKDSTAEYDKDGNQISAGDGQITGGNNIQGGQTQGGGVYVEKGTVTLDSGNITGNTAKTNGGGVGVGKSGAQGDGAGASFTMNGGKISGNTAGSKDGDGGGGGVWVKNGASFIMTGGEITGNKVTNEKNQGNGGGVAIHQATFTMEGGKIYDNEAPRGTGVLINAGNSQGGNASFTMKGGYVSGDKDTSCIYMEEGQKGGNATLTLQGKAVLDGSIFLGKGAQVKTDNVMQPDGTHPYTSFDVTDTDGNKVDESITGTGNSTIGPAQTESDDGYECRPTDGEESQDLLLDIQYAHAWKDKYSPDKTDEGEDAGTHSHHCQYCSETNGTTNHSWDVDQTGKVTKEPTETEKGERTFTDRCSDCGQTKTRIEEIDAKDGDDSDESGNDPVNDPGPTIIDDPEVPLAGLFTRADAIGYLWEQAGSPDAELSDFADVPEDHQWAVAIGWAQDNGIAVADLEGNFRPDDLVLRSVEDIELSPEGELQEFLNRYAVHAGIELDEGELFIELDGSWDDIIMGEDAQVIFDGFFVRLELALAQAA